MDPRDIDRGWCCDCNAKIGDALSCTPASADACVGKTLAWCELDEEGKTTACADQCDNLGWCCDCLAQPDAECWRAPEDACYSHRWCLEDPIACAGECPPTVCCDCNTKICSPSDGSDCDQPHEKWCAGVDCLGICEQADEFAEGRFR